MNQTETKLFNEPKIHHLISLNIEKTGDYCSFAFSLLHVKK
jgi:hypothetical protein